jgi:hypothetical protein
MRSLFPAPGESPSELFEMVLDSFRGVVSQARTGHPGAVAAAYVRYRTLRDLWRRYSSHFGQELKDRAIREVNGLKVFLPPEPDVVPCPQCGIKEGSTVFTKSVCSICDGWGFITRVHYQMRIRPDDGTGLPWWADR